MNKEASDLLRLALQSLLVGGGAYGGARLLTDLAKGTKKKEKPENELELTLPADRMPKMAGDPLGDYILPALTGVGGVAGGFLGASKLYEHLKKKQLNNKIKDVEKEYLAALQHAHQKTAEVATPYIDKFLEGMISKVGELANKEGFAGVDFPTENVLDTTGKGIWKAIRSLGDTQLGSAAQAAAALAALSSGAGVYYIQKQMEKQRDSNKKHMTLPTDIKLNIA